MSKMDDFEVATPIAALKDDQTIFTGYNNTSPNYSTTLEEMQLDCIRHMGANGIPFEAPLLIDDRIHRFSIDHKRTKKDEWYAARIWEFRERWYLCCNYGSWSSDNTYTYKSWEEKNEYLSPFEKDQMEKNILQMKIRADEERKIRQDEVAKEAQDIWNEASLTPPEKGQHIRYLQMKGVKPHHVRFDVNLQGHDALLIPILNIEEEIRSLQFISLGGDGTSFKSFLPGGEYSGPQCQD